MGSNVLPYFILSPAPLSKPSSEQVHLEQKRQTDYNDTTPPITPAPSGASHFVNELGLFNKKNKAKLVRCNIPVNDIRKRETLTKKMELIKLKLEKSRERFNEKKMDLSNDLRCEPTVLGSSVSQPASKMERSVTDLTHDRINDKQKQSGTGPYFYFVVNEDQERDADFGLGNEEKLTSKSADKRRRVRIVEENRLKRDRRERQNKTAKIQGLARELGLKSSLKSSTENLNMDTSVRVHPSVNQIVFQGPPCEEASFNRGKLRMISSPPDTLFNQSASANSGDNKFDIHGPDTDENVPRKPFLSGPLYSGKTRAHHTMSTALFELPNISADQKRRALGLSSSSRFEEYAYNARPRQKDRTVSFAEPLPGIRGNAVSFDIDKDNLDQFSLGPRANTLGTIKLPSERTEQQTLCQKFLLGENMTSARSIRKFGVPLSLPKIDIVSNVYDEMIIKMIQEYLNDSNTPTRQSQLAKDLLVQLQKHNEKMKEMNVPTLRTSKNGKMDLAKHLASKHFASLAGQLDFPAPPNTAEGTKRTIDMQPMSGIEEDTDEKADATIGEGGNGDATQEAVEEEVRDITTREAQRDVPFVQITFKNNKDLSENDPEKIPENVEVDADSSEKQSTPSRGSAARAKALRDEKPCRSPVTPVSFQMAPPGLSKEDTQSSIQLRTN